PLRLVTTEAEARREALVVPPLPDADGSIAFSNNGPTEIKEVVKDVAGWSGRRYVVDRNVNGKGQIFSGAPMAKRQAFQVFLLALDRLGLGESGRGAITQIRPLRNIVTQRELRLTAPPLSADGTGVLDFPEVVDIRDVLAQVRPWYGRDLVLDREVG